MKQWSLQPDEHMKWIYEPHHPDCNSEKAQDLRNRLEYALKNAPQWMIAEAMVNDMLTKK